MAIFFVVGLEIKREVLVGKSASLRQASLSPRSWRDAGAGGHLRPDGSRRSRRRRQGVPMATDIAFCPGRPGAARPARPLALKVFLTALAVIDDIGAVLVIALFYTSQSPGPASRLRDLVPGGARSRQPAGGAHPAGLRGAGPGPVAGSPAVGRPRHRGREPPGHDHPGARPHRRRRLPGPRPGVPGRLCERRRAPGAAGDGGQGARASFIAEGQQTAVLALEEACEHVQTPLHRLEHALHPWVAFCIMPLFALANAGVTLGGDIRAVALRRSGGPGVFAGLILERSRWGSPRPPGWRRAPGWPPCPRVTHLAPRIRRDLAGLDRLHHVPVHRHAGLRRRGTGSPPSASWRR